MCRPGHISGDIEIFRTSSARSETFLEWAGPQLAYVWRSTSQHFPNLVGFNPQIGNLGNAARGFVSRPYRTIWGTEGSVRRKFPIFGVLPGSPIIFPTILIIRSIPITGIWLYPAWAATCVYICSDETKGIRLREQPSHLWSVAEKKCCCWLFSGPSMYTCLPH